MRVLVLNLLAVGLATSLSAQQSLFQDSKGDTALYLTQAQNKGNALVNFGSSKISAGYVRSVGRADTLRMGFQILGTAQNGVATIIRNGAPQAGVGGNVDLVWNIPRNLPPPEPDAAPGEDCRLCGHWVVLDFGYLRSTVNTVLTKQPLQPADDHNFDRYTMKIAYNALLKNMSNDFLLGIVAGVDRKNNTDSLTTVQVSTDFVRNLQNTQEVISQNTKAAYLGVYQKYIAAPINVDFIWFPRTNRMPRPTKDNPQPNKSRNHWVLDFFERSDVGEASQYHYISPGAGIFLTQAGEPTKPIGGVTVAYKSGKAQVAVVTGWTF